MGDPMNFIRFFISIFSVPQYPLPHTKIMRTKHKLMINIARAKVGDVLRGGRFTITFLANQSITAYYEAVLALLKVQRFDRFIKFYDQLIDSLLCIMFLKRRARVNFKNPRQLLQDALNNRSSATDAMIDQLFEESVLSKKTEKGRESGMKYFISTMIRFQDSLSLQNIEKVNSLCEYDVISGLKWLYK